jgi:Trk K+ transport system NAD-binding subunit
MENPFEIIIEKLINIENIIVRIENQLYPKKIIKKKTTPLITEEEAREYLFRSVFNILR